MGYHPRIESDQFLSFITMRCAQSRMWFLHNKKLEERILAHLAKYLSVYGVLLYAMSIEGNHLHLLLGFPKMNRGAFMRDFTSTVAKLVDRYCSSFEGGQVFGRRYSYEIVPPDTEDIEDRFFYTVLQQVQDGVVQKLSQYKYYNCFNDAAREKTREYQIVNWNQYKRASRGKKKVNIKDYETTYTLSYERIPGYEHLSQSEYFSYLSKTLETRRVKVVKERLSQGKGFITEEKLKRIPAGSKPRQSKTSERYSFRPRVLSLCQERKAYWKEFYFECYYEFKRASEKLRRGVLDAVFPKGMYKPSVCPS